MRALILSIVLLVGCQKPNEISNSTDVKTVPKEIANSTILKSALKEITNNFGNSIGMKLVLIPAGTFTMGSPDRSSEQHEVTLSKSYYLGAFEVTQNEYERVMGNNLSKSKGYTNPVEMVSWDEAVSFCKKLSEMPMEKAAGREYRLPTEAEWEYACRADNSEADSFGKDNSFKSLLEYAWFSWNRVGSDVTTHRVGEKKSNQWGLYDMHGNVGEWCQDWFGKYPTGAVTDPQGPNGGSSRVNRGGSWSDSAENCQAASRRPFGPRYRASSIGFRVALSPSVKQPEAEGNNEYK